MKSFKSILLSFILFSFMPFLAESADQNSKTCDFDPKYQQFDFWLGQWSVYGDLQKSTPLFGKNRIEKQQKGCLLMEYWSGASGSTGTSMNYYDGTKNKWVQHWVSADGTTINIEGGLVAGSMVLTGKIYYKNTKENPVRDFRGTWSKEKNNIVKQFFEESVDSGKNWYKWFEGYYFPLIND